IADACRISTSSLPSSRYGPTKAEWNDCNASATPFCTRSDGPLAYGEDNAVPARPTNERGWQCGKRWQRRSSSSKPQTRHSDVCSETPSRPAPPAAMNPTPLDLSPGYSTSASMAAQSTDETAGQRSDARGLRQPTGDTGGPVG